MPESTVPETWSQRWMRMGQERRLQSLTEHFGTPKAEEVAPIAPSTALRAAADLPEPPREPQEATEAGGTPDPVPTPGRAPESAQEGQNRTVAGRRRPQERSPEPFDRAAWWKGLAAAIPAGLARGIGEMESTVLMAARGPHAGVRYDRKSIPPGLSEMVEEWADSHIPGDHMAAQFVKGAAQFAPGWMAGGPVVASLKAAAPGLKALGGMLAKHKAGRVAGAMAQGTARGAVADFMTIGHDDALLSQIIQEQFPGTDPLIFDALAEPSEDVLGHKVKAMAEGGLIGAGLEGVLRGVVAVRRAYRENTAAVDEYVASGQPAPEEAAQAQPATEAAPAATPVLNPLPPLEQMNLDRQASYLKPLTQEQYDAMAAQREADNALLAQRAAPASEPPAAEAPAEAPATDMQIRTGSPADLARSRGDDKAWLDEISGRGTAEVLDTTDVDAPEPKLPEQVMEEREAAAHRSATATPDDPGFVPAPDWTTVQHQPATLASIRGTLPQGMDTNVGFQGGTNGQLEMTYSGPAAKLRFEVAGFREDLGVWTFKEHGSEKGNEWAFSPAHVHDLNAAVGRPTADVIAIPETEAMSAEAVDTGLSIQPLTRDAPPEPTDPAAMQRMVDESAEVRAGEAKAITDGVFSALEAQGAARSLGRAGFVRLGDTTWLRVPDGSGTLLRTPLKASDLEGAPSAAATRLAALAERMGEAAPTRPRPRGDQSEKATRLLSQARSNADEARWDRQVATPWARSLDDSALVIPREVAGGDVLRNARLSRNGARDLQDDVRASMRTEDDAVDGAFRSRMSHWNDGRLAVNEQAPVDYSRWQDPGTGGIAADLAERARALDEGAPADVKDMLTRGHAATTQALDRLLKRGPDPAEAPYTANPAAADAAYSMLSQSSNQVWSLARAGNDTEAARAAAAHTALVRHLRGDDAGAAEMVETARQGFAPDEARAMAAELRAFSDVESFNAWFTYSPPPARTVDQTPAGAVDEGWARNEPLVDTQGWADAADIQAAREAVETPEAFEAGLAATVRRMAARAVTPGRGTWDDFESAADSAVRAAAALTADPDKARVLLATAARGGTGEGAGIGRLLRDLAQADDAPTVTARLQEYARERTHGMRIEEQMARGREASPPPAVEGTRPMAGQLVSPETLAALRSAPPPKQPGLRAASMLFYQGLFGLRTIMDIGVGNTLVMGMEVGARYTDIARAALVGSMRDGPPGAASQALGRANAFAREALSSALTMHRAALAGWNPRARNQATAQAQGMDWTLERMRDQLASTTRLDMLEDFRTGASDADAAAADLFPQHRRWALVTNAMGAMDMMGREGFARAHLAELAWRAAGERGLEGTAARDFAKDWMAAPPREAFEAAVEFANERVFMSQLDGASKSQVERHVHGLQRWLAERGVAGALVRFAVLPVMKSPFLITRFAWRSVVGGARIGGRGGVPQLAVLSKQMREDLAAGGARGQLARARVNMARGILITTFALADDDRITGGDVTAAWGERMDRKRSGVAPPPYSMRVGDTWVDYSRIPMLGGIMGLAADLRSILAYAGSEVEELTITRGVAATMLAIGAFTTNNMFTRDIARMMEMVADAGTDGGAGRLAGHMARQAANFIPFKRPLSEIEAMTGPGGRELYRPYSVRDGDAVVDQARRELMNVWQRVPFLNPELPNDVDIDGNEIDRRSVLGHGVFGRAGHALIPYQLVAESNDPVHRVYRDLGHYPRAPEPHAFGGTVPLEPEEHRALKMLWGQQRRQAEVRLVGSAAWQAMTNTQRVQRLQVLDAEAKRLARAQVERDPGLRARRAEVADGLQAGTEAVRRLSPALQGMIQQAQQGAP